MKQLVLIYISLTGNTKSFVTRLSDYLKEHQINVSTINIKDLKHEKFSVDRQSVAFLPTYLEGGNGIDNGDVEILTNPLGDFLAFQDNYKNCLGIVGSGNRNFNEQFCLTAKQYSQRFGFPVIDEFELRGQKEDIVRIGNKILEML